jgi:hypothetical protein
MEKDFIQTVLIDLEADERIDGQPTTPKSPPLEFEIQTSSHSRSVRFIEPVR